MHGSLSVGNSTLAADRIASLNLLNNWRLTFMFSHCHCFQSLSFVLGFNNMRGVLPSSSTSKTWAFH